MNEKKSSKLVLEEDRAKGRVDIKLLWQYVKYLGGPTIIFLLAALSVTYQLAQYVAPIAEIFRDALAKGYHRLGFSFFLGVWSGR